MHREGHIGVAMAFYAPVAAVIAALEGSQLALLIGGGVAALCMLPDIDMKIPTIEHRGPTHTIYFVLGITAFLTMSGLAVGLSEGGFSNAIILGAVFGLVGLVALGSHLAADMLTPMGVDPWATGNRRSYNLTRAANPIANMLLLGIGLLVLLVAISAGTSAAL